MPVTRHMIEGRPTPPPGSCHVTSATGNRIIHISGQVGTDDDGNVVPGGLAAQTEQAIHNLARAVQASGASVQDIVMLRFYVVDWDRSKFEELGQGGQPAFRQHEFAEAAVTLVGVTSLFTSDMLIEIEAVAVVD